MNPWQPADSFRYLNEALSDSEREAFEEQLEGDPALQLALNNAQSLLEGAQLAKDAASTLRVNQVRNAVINGKRPAVPLIRLNSWHAPALAGLVLLVVVISKLVLMQPSHEPLWTYKAPPTLGEEEGPVWLPLADGSKVSPSPDTLWALEKQHVDLIALSLTAGSIECQVNPEKDGRAFVVRAHGVTVRVTGTAFRIEAKENGEVSVEVLHGSVDVQDGKSTHALTKGDRISRVSRTAPLVVSGLPPVPNTAKGTTELPETLSFKKAKETPLESAGTLDDTPAKLHLPRIPGITPPLAKGTKRGTKRGTKSIPEVKGPQTPTPLQALPVVPEAAATRLPAINPDGIQQALSAPVTEEMIQIQLPHQRQETAATPTAGPPSGEKTEESQDSQSALAAPALNLLRNGKTTGALSALASIQKRGLSTTVRADLLYLEGYAHHLEGRDAIATQKWKEMETLDPENPWIQTVGDWFNPPAPQAHKLR